MILHLSVTLSTGRVCCYFLSHSMFLFGVVMSLPVWSHVLSGGWSLKGDTPEGHFQSDGKYQKVTFQEGQAPNYWHLVTATEADGMHSCTILFYVKPSKQTTKTIRWTSQKPDGLADELYWFREIPHFPRENKPEIVSCFMTCSHSDRCCYRVVASSYDLLAIIGKQVWMFWAYWIDFKPKVYKNAFQ